MRLAESSIAPAAAFHAQAQWSKRFPSSERQAALDEPSDDEVQGGAGEQRAGARNPHSRRTRRLDSFGAFAGRQGACSIPAWSRARRLREHPWSRSFEMFPARSAGALPAAARSASAETLRLTSSSHRPWRLRQRRSGLEARPRRAGRQRKLRARDRLDGCRRPIIAGPRLRGPGADACAAREIGSEVVQHLDHSADEPGALAGGSPDDEHMPF